MSDENKDELRATKLIGRANGPRLSHRQMTTSGRRNSRSFTTRNAEKGVLLAALA
ncbi:MAG: hypothetical protein V3R35_06340 [Woeseiaceae bacterium]